MRILQDAEERQTAMAAAPSKAAQKRARKKAAARAAAAAPPTAEPPATQQPESADVSGAAEGMAVPIAHTTSSETGQDGSTVAAGNGREHQQQQHQQQQRQAPAWALCPIIKVCAAWAGKVL
jgi:hypothetical protein